MQDVGEGTEILRPGRRSPFRGALRWICANTYGTFPTFRSRASSSRTSRRCSATRRPGAGRSITSSNATSGSVDVVLGIESRGFIVGAALAYALGVGLAVVRKPGKLPASDVLRAVRARVRHRLARDPPRRLRPSVPRTDRRRPPRHRRHGAGGDRAGEAAAAARSSSAPSSSSSTSCTAASGWHLAPPIP